MSARLVGENKVLCNGEVFDVTPKNDPDFGLICICAERYAIDRSTYMPTVVIEFIANNLKSISNKHLRVLIDDIEYAIESNRAGDAKVDTPGWAGLLVILKVEMQSR